MAKQFSISEGNHNKVGTSLADYIDSILATGGTAHIEVSPEKASTGKWGLARLWRAWMATTAKWMTENGATMPLVINKDGQKYGSRPFSADDAHELFSAKFLPVQPDGTRLSWSKDANNGKVKADKGQRLHAMQQHDAWATERGIYLFRPGDSDYMEMINRQNS